MDLPDSFRLLLLLSEFDQDSCHQLQYIDRICVQIPVQIRFLLDLIRFMTEVMNGMKEESTWQ